MNKKSSNQNMEPNLDILKSINQVEAPPHLFNRVLRKVAIQKENRILNMYLKVAAAAILLFAISDIYLLKNNRNTSNKNQLVELIPQQNNQLYGE